jgi:transcriptional regulator with XRE-family HTH domain
MGKRSMKKIITKEVRVIRSLREKKKLSVQKAAALIGTNKSTLTALENGRIDLSHEWINKIIKSYGINDKQFVTLIEAKDGFREEVIEEINELLNRISFEKVQLIRQMVLGLMS